MPPSPRYAPMQPGDVAAVHTAGKLVAPLIRIGEWLAGRPHTVNHVVVAHHWDGNRLVGIEADPSGGVQWVDVNRYDNAWFLHNAAQPKTAGQRIQICDDATSVLHARYDWMAIAWDALALTGLTPPDRWQRNPRSFVCSSFASWLYQRASLVEPSSPGRWVTPGDWAAFIETRAWATAAAS